MNKQAISCLIYLGLFSGCMKEEVRTIEKGNKIYGPTDSGGGNGVNGRPLESYIQNITQDRLFIKKIVPIIQKIALSSSDFAGDLYHVALHRKWFFVPIALRAIPSNLISVSFQTDQLALQTAREIWFDNNLYSKMSEEDQTIIILHELIMGTRLLEFRGGYDLCLAHSAKLLFNFENEAAIIQVSEDIPIPLTKEYENSKSECNKSYINIGILNGEKPMDLKDSDYTVIRSTTSEIFGDWSMISKEQLNIIYKQLRKSKN